MGDVYTDPPQSRNEAILRATIDGTEYTAPPQSRIEDLLLELKEAIEQGGTGEGDMKKSVYDSDNSVATAGGIKMFVNQKIGTLPQRVGSLETTAGVLEGEVASIEDTLDNLGTASTKNSTSVVTESSDLVESGAVFDAIKTVSDAVADLEAFVGYENSPCVGIQVDFDNGTFKRLGSASSTADFDLLPMFGGRRRCNLADNGTVNAYYGDSGYVEDGTNGQVMVEQPKFYYKVQPVKKTAQSLGYALNVCNYYVSEVQLDGFKIHPAFVDADGNERDKIYIGAYEGCLYDVSTSAYITNDAQVMDNTADKFSSIANAKPASGLTQDLTRPKIEQMCQNRGSRWHELNMQIANLEILLPLIEYGTFDFQRVIGQGVVNITDNSSYNCSAITGSTASLGNKSGRASSTNVEIGGTTTAYTEDGKTSVTYRGVENDYGNIWKFVMGMNVYGDGSKQMGIPYICTDYNYEESKNTGNYKSIGFMLPSAGGWQKNLGYGNADLDWVFMPISVGGNNAKPIGDYVWGTTSLNGFRIARLGGTWINGWYAGGLGWGADGGVGGRGRSLSGRLAYI